MALFKKTPTSPTTVGVATVTKMMLKQPQKSIDAVEVPPANTVFQFTVFGHPTIWQKDSNGKVKRVGIVKQQSTEDAEFIERYNRLVKPKTPIVIQPDAPTPV